MLRIDNAAARRLFLLRHGLSGPRPQSLIEEIEGLGFVQVDSVNTVERAHHMILAARRRSYRPRHLKTLLERKRLAFEHWTHDASVIPMTYFPYWQGRFARDRKVLVERWRKFRRPGFEEQVDAVRDHIRATGPTRARDVGDDDGELAAPSSDGGAGWWDWRPSKTALEFLWRTGEIAVCRRDGFQKVFDLTERVVGPDLCAEAPDHADIVDWAAAGALDRLGFGTSGEIAAFWETVSATEAKAWCAARLGEGLIEAEVEGADGKPRRVFARPDLADAAAAAPSPPAGVRILSPFDPALRDRKRAEWLFGFSYRIEIFVPEAKRRYGYYVFPVLEGARLIGRIDMRRAGPGGPLNVRAFWPERGVAMGKGRQARLQAEIARIGRFAEADGVAYAEDWIRNPL